MRIFPTLFSSRLSKITKPITVFPVPVSVPILDPMLPFVAWLYSHSPRPGLQRSYHCHKSRKAKPPMATSSGLGCRSEENVFHCCLLIWLCCFPGVVCVFARLSACLVVGCMCVLNNTLLCVYRHERRNVACKFHFERQYRKTTMRAKTKLYARTMRALCADVQTRNLTRNLSNTHPYIVDPGFNKKTTREVRAAKAYWTGVQKSLEK